MTYSPARNPEPLPEATLADVRATIDGLKPGVYRNSDLYKRYVDLMSNQGREPVSASRLGRMFTDYGLLAATRTVAGQKFRARRVS
jgi:hypothetical protein